MRSRHKDSKEIIKYFRLRVSRENTNIWEMSRIKVFSVQRQIKENRKLCITVLEKSTNGREFLL